MIRLAGSVLGARCLGSAVPTRTERGHFRLVAQRNDFRLPLVGAVVIFFLFVADIRGRKNKLEDKASSQLACEQALPPPSLPTAVSLAHRLAAFFFPLKQTVQQSANVYF